MLSNWISRVCQNKDIGGKSYFWSKYSFYSYVMVTWGVFSAVPGIMNPRETRNYLTGISLLIKVTQSCVLACVFLILIPTLDLINLTMSLKSHLLC